MAGKKPFFITGANAKVKVNNKTLAFCTDVSYSVKINHASPIVLGMYESTGIEPLSYEVTGKFTVIRYIGDAASIGADPNGVQREGNGIGNWGKNNYYKSLKDFDLNDGRANEALIPRFLQRATGFDIEIFQKAPGDQFGVARIRGARIIQADFSLSKKSPGMQVFTFKAVYVDEDSFLADFSGEGQQNT